MLEAPVEASKIMTPPAIPGAALVNYLPFCALPDSHPSTLVGLTAILSGHSFMGSIPQLRTIGAYG